MAKAKSTTKAESKKPAKASGSTAGRVKAKAVKLAANPLVAEVVAATLVAAAAALRDPKKARDLAEAAADELGTAGKQLSETGGALWQLARDVAKQSTDALGGETGDQAPDSKKKKGKGAKKKKKKK